MKSRMLKKHKQAPHEQPLAEDTLPEARQALVRVYQQMPPERKATIVGDLRRMSRQLFDAGYRARHPGVTEDELIVAWMRHTLDPELYEKARIVRDEYTRRRLARGAQSGAIAGADGVAVRPGGIAGQFGPGSAAGNE
ncbi:MAG: hypothetical protein WD872_19460 [Pirellulaceae bacterium]